ncbi:hypothetical protein BBO99_00004411 [Phytophthora kernoviae]|uniref:Calcineurin-like phosphoesterase domain-containing protein n=1 Tax=Phytophthora kernoviae TaxID=325452 RepID=A0A3R7JUS8_9STRA|nr:hypothetical protein BBO99_00004411 [Phytophthora kernoviae]
MKVVCVSDTHGLHDQALDIPQGDVFIHAGDFTDTGERNEVLAFNQFLGTLPHRYKIVIAGNHESTFDREFYPKYWHQYGHRQQYDPDEVRALLTNALYLEDQAVLIEGYLFYGGKTKLREFRVDGTTSGLLFESTLKLRPVVNVEKRALRYLFSQGFQSNTENYKVQSSESEVVTAENHGSTDAPAASMEVDSEGGEPTAERRRYGLSRRVTVAMLDGINESREQMDELDREHMQQARVAAANLGKDPGSADAAGGEGARARRPRRNKTLQRRSAVPKLASLTEEPSEPSDKEESDAASAQGDDETKTSSVDAATEVIVMAQPVIECVLCKYKVSGHVHPEAEVIPPPAPAEPTTVAPPVVECALCKYKVPGHVHPGAQFTPPPPPVDPIPKEPKEERPKEAKEQRSRADNPPPKRLSSWF